MIAIDTNVLLRYLLQDDEKQADKAAKIILGSERVLVTDVVLTETVWTLKGKRYNLTKEQIIDVIHALFMEPNLTFEDGQAVWGALKDFTNAKSIKAKRYGQVNKSSISTIYTFDQVALQIDGTKLPR